MLSARDHTGEVERRVTAIPICATDTCGFFTPRPSALILQRECWYCLHASFPKSAEPLNPAGFCKFKK